MTQSALYFYGQDTMLLVLHNAKCNSTQHYLWKGSLPDWTLKVAILRVKNCSGER